MVAEPPSFGFSAGVVVAAVLVGFGGFAVGVPDRVAPSRFVDNPTRATDPNRPCDIPVHKEVQLTTEERCVLELHKKRCDEHDVCIVDCITNGKGLVRLADGGVGNIGGGCWHVCFAYTEIEWTTPEGFEECSLSKSETK